MNVRDEIVSAVYAKGPITEREISEAIFGLEKGYQQRVNQYMSSLVKSGVLARRGRGQNGDPFVYFRPIS